MTGLFLAADQLHLLHEYLVFCGRLTGALLGGIFIGLSLKLLLLELFPVVVVLPYWLCGGVTLVTSVFYCIQTTRVLRLH